MGTNREKHSGVTGPAEFGTRAVVGAGGIGQKPQSRRMPWSCVHLAGEPGNPKAVNDVLTRCDDFYGHSNGDMQCIDRRWRALVIEIEKLPLPHARAGFDAHRIACAVPDEKQTFALCKRIGKQEDKHRNGESQASTDDP